MGNFKYYITGLVCVCLLSAFGPNIIKAAEVISSTTYTAGLATKQNKISLQSCVTGKVFKSYSAGVFKCVSSATAHNQAATTITEDTTHRFTTDTEKSTWGGKQASGDYATNTALSTKRDSGYLNYSGHDHTTPVIDANISGNTSWWTGFKSTLKTYFDGLYIWAAGKAGGQTIYGGTAAGESITITGTSSATKSTSGINLGVLHVDEVNGRVGIGATSPIAKLQVNGQSAFGDSATTNSLAQAGGTLNLISTDAVQNITRISANINTASPGVELKHATSLANAEAGTFDSNWDFFTSSTGFKIRDRKHSDVTPLTIEESAPTGSFYIKSSGNVGIGTTQPNEKLEVVGNIKASAFIGDGTQITGIAGASTFATYTSNDRLTKTEAAATYLTPTGSGAGLSGVVKPADIAVWADNKPINQPQRFNFNGPNIAFTNRSSTTMQDIEVLESRNVINGGTFEQNYKLGINTDAARGYRAAINAGSPYIACFGDAWNCTLDRVDYTYKVAHDMGTKWAREWAMPVNLNRWETDYAGELVVPSDADGWEAVDRAVYNARKYGMQIILTLPLPADSFPGAKYNKFATGTDGIIDKWITPIAAYVANRYKYDWDVVSIDPGNEFTWLTQSFITDATNYGCDTTSCTAFDTRWINYQEAVYNSVKAVQPLIRVNLVSTGTFTAAYAGAAYSITGMIDQLNTAGKMGVFDEMVNVHLYPSNTYLVAPDWYGNASIPAGKGGLADVTLAKSKLDSYGRSDAKVSIQEFGKFWDTTAGYEQDSADSMEYLYNWAKGSSSVGRLLSWEFWGSDRAQSNTWRSFAQTGMGVMAEDNKRETLLGAMLRQVTDAASAKFYQKIVFRNGSTAQLPAWAEKGEALWADNSRMYVGKGFGVTPVMVNKLIVAGSNVTVNETAAQIEINASVTGTALTIEESDGTPTGTPSTLKVTNGTLTDNGGGVFTLAVGGSGTVTGVSSANADIGVSMSSPTPVLTLNSGTGNNQIVKLNSTGQLPALDASNLTSVAIKKTTNISMGVDSMAANLTGQYNIALGGNALKLFNPADTRGENIAIGYQAGQALTGSPSGTRNVFLGSNAGKNVTTVTSSIALGYNAQVTASNTCVIGGSGADLVSIQNGDGTFNVSTVGAVTAKSVALSGDIKPITYTETTYAPAAGSAFTVSLANGTVQYLTTNANTTITLPAPVLGRSYSLIVKYGGTHTITWAGGGSGIKWSGGTAPTATSESGKYDRYCFDSDEAAGYVLGDDCGRNH